MPERFLVFIPAYNCEKQVPRVLNQLLDRQVAAMVTECIVVNNRSTDGTEAAVQSWMQAHPQAPVRLLRNDQNYGLGGSHKVAFQYAVQHNFDYLIVLHGDDQGDIRDVLPWYTAAATVSMIAALAPVLCRKAASRATALCVWWATMALTGCSAWWPGTRSPTWAAA